MKKLPILFFLILSLSVFSQSDIYFGKSQIVPAEVILENGEVKTGFLQNFKVARYARSLINFNGLERTFNYDLKEYEFKEKMSSAVQKLKIDDIKRIIILNNDGTDHLTYDKMKLKTINTKNEVVDLNKTVILPLIEEGKLSIYGIAVVVTETTKSVFGSDTDYLGVMFMPYLKSSDSEYAYLPFDINRINLFNLGSLEGKFKKAVEESTKSCPEFQSVLNEAMKTFEKMSRKEMKQAYYDKEKRKKQIRKNTKDKEEENFMQMKEDVDYALKPFLWLADEYNKTCSK